MYSAQVFVVLCVCVPQLGVHLCTCVYVCVCLVYTTCVCARVCVCFWISNIHQVPQLQHIDRGFRRMLRASMRPHTRNGGWC